MRGEEIWMQDKVFSFFHMCDLSKGEMLLVPDDEAQGRTNSVDISKSISMVSRAALRLPSSVGGISIISGYDRFRNEYSVASHDSLGITMEGASETKTG